MDLYDLTTEGAVLDFPRSNHKLTFEFSTDEGYVGDLPAAYRVPLRVNGQCLIECECFGYR